MVKDKPKNRYLSPTATYAIWQYEAKYALKLERNGSNVLLNFKNESLILYPSKGDNPHGRKIDPPARNMKNSFAIEVVLTWYRPHESTPEFTNAIEGSSSITVRLIHEVTRVSCTYNILEEKSSIASNRYVLKSDIMGGQ